MILPIVATIQAATLDTVQPYGSIRITASAKRNPTPAKTLAVRKGDLVEIEIDDTDDGSGSGITLETAPGKNGKTSLTSRLELVGEDTLTLRMTGRSPKLEYLPGSLRIIRKVKPSDTGTAVPGFTVQDLTRGIVLPTDWKKSHYVINVTARIK